MINLTKRIRKRIGSFCQGVVRRSLRRQFSKYDGRVDKIHVGCGDHIVPGWVNIGLFHSSERPYGKIIQSQGTALILNFNLTQNLPISEGSIQFIYSCHFIEHLTAEEGKDFLTWCYFALKKNGVIRIGFPDLEIFVKNYYERNSEFIRQWQSLNGEKVANYGELLAKATCGYGHKYVYDFEMMRRALAERGFGHIVRCSFRESSFPDINRLEPFKRSLTSCFVEAKKI